MKNSEMKYFKAQKLDNFGRPKYCISCNKLMKPALHPRIIKEGLMGSTRLSKLYKDKCEWCDNEFEYWS